MASVPVPNVAEVQIRGALAGQLVETALYYLFTGTITESALVTLIGGFATYAAAHIAGIMSTAWEGREIHARDLSAGSGLQATNTDIAGLAGTLAGEPLPNNVCLAIARKSGLAGRKYNGRVFWPGWADSDLASTNVFDSGRVAGRISFLEGLDSAAVDEGWTPVIVSTRAASDAGVATVTPLAIWNVVDMVIDSRRRRLPGRGV